VQHATQLIPLHFYTSTFYTEWSLSHNSDWIIELRCNSSISQSRYSTWPVTSRRIKSLITELSDDTLSQWINRHTCHRGRCVDGQSRRSVPDVLPSVTVLTTELAESSEQLIDNSDNESYQWPVNQTKANCLHLASASATQTNNMDWIAIKSAATSIAKRENM